MMTVICKNCGKETRRMKVGTELCNKCLLLSYSQKRERICPVCKKQFSTPNNRTKLCSRACYGKTKIGVLLGETTRRKMSLGQKGNKSALGKHWELTPEQRKEWSKVQLKLRENPEYVKRMAELVKRGVEQKLWKGEEAGYTAKHNWIRRYGIKINNCANCGRVGSGHQLHWANKDHKYRRVLEDWLRLCAKCHAEYDKQHNLRHRKERF